MTCSDVDRKISEGMRGQALRSTVANHVAGCSRCQSLLEFLDAPIPLPFDEDTHRRTIQARLKQDLRPTRKLPSAPRIILGVVTIALVILGISTWLMGLRGYNALSPWHRTALIFYCFSLDVLLALALHQMFRPASRQLLPTHALLAVLLIGYPLLAMVLFPLQPVEHFFEEGIVCLAFGLIAAAITSVPIVFLVRGGHPFRHTLAGATVGGLSGLTAILILTVICSDHDAAHIALWHGLTVALSIVTGCAIGYFISRRA